jgi:phage recombination protein Bet
MTTDVAVRTNGTAADFTREQIDLIKQTVAKNTTDAQLKLFLYTARTRGLDPLLKQMHAVERKGEMAIQVGIDGLRLIAARTGDYAGNDEPVFIEGDKYPSKATVTVWRLVQGERRAFTDSAYWAEFYPDDSSGFMWRKLPHVMLGKVAESRALRKAFPHETSGLYVDEEMHQADRDIVQSAQPAPIRVVDAVTAEVVMPAEQPKPSADEVKAQLKARVAELQLAAATMGAVLPDVTACKNVGQVKRWIEAAELAIEVPF